MSHHDADDTDRVISQYAHHQRVLGAMALRRPLTEVLTHIVDAIESAAIDVLGSVLLLDERGTHLLRGAAPSLPTSYTDALHGLVIGPKTGCCGTAAFTRCSVIAEDVLIDPLWDDYRHLVAPIGLRSCWSTPILNRDGAVLGTFAVYSRQPRRPSTEELKVIDELTSLASVAIQQARAESSLTRREAYFRAVVDSAPTAIIAMDGTGRIADVNAAGLQLLQRTREEVVGTSLLNSCATEARERVAAWIVTAMRTSHPIACDVPLRMPDGGTRWLMMSLACVTRGDSSPMAELLAVGQDITARINTETEARRNERQLRDAQKTEAVSRLAGGVAHDFNNLLTVIQGNTALVLQRPSTDAESRVALGEVQSAAQRAAALTRQLLAFSHRDTMPSEVVDLGALLSAVQQSATPLLSDRVALRVTRTDLALPVRVMRAAVEDALSSVLLSARESMPDGGLLDIQLDLTTIDAETAISHNLVAGSFARLRIRDTGPAMDADARSRAFEPFPAPAATGRHGGMGLATLFALATRARGTLLLESEGAFGTTVTLLLPLAIDGAQARPITGEHAIVQAGVTVLVVEDEDAVRQLIRRVLTGAGYRVITATDGEDALAVWHRHGDEIDVLVTDMVMPRMMGGELIARLRNERSSLPIVVCSGYSDSLTTELPLSDARSAYLSKPFSLQSLIDAVANVNAAARATAGL